MSVYLSRLRLSLSSGLVRRDLADVQQMHRTVMSMFPQAPDGSDPRALFGVLHRVGGQDTSGAVEVLLQSNVEPDVSSLPAGYCARRPETKEVEAAYGALGEGAVLRFRLDANPTKSISLGSGAARGRRVPVLTVEGQIAWLRGHAGDWGFEVVEVRLVESRLLSGRARGASDRRLTLAQFEGTLRVTDQALFGDALVLGFGRGRAFGLGLMTVSRARR